jgi:hypothetical protein
MRGWLKTNVKTNLKKGLVSMKLDTDHVLYYLRYLRINAQPSKNNPFV